MERSIKSGAGWRVGWHPHGGRYQGLLGAEDWAIELTAAELADFYRLLGQLVNMMNQMQQELMDQERIDCEAETDLLWMEVSGYPSNYSLRVIVNSGRRCEGNWAENVAPELLKALSSFDFTSGD